MVNELAQKGGVVFEAQQSYFRVGDIFVDLFLRFVERADSVPVPHLMLPFVEALLNEFFKRIYLSLKRGKGGPTPVLDAQETLMIVDALKAIFQRKHESQQLGEGMLSVTDLQIVPRLVGVMRSAMTQVIWEEGTLCQDDEEGAEGLGEEGSGARVAAVEANRSRRLCLSRIISALSTDRTFVVECVEETHFIDLLGSFIFTRNELPLYPPALQALGTLVNSNPLCGALVEKAHKCGLLDRLLQALETSQMEPMMTMEIVAILGRAAKVDAGHAPATHAWRMKTLDTSVTWRSFRGQRHDLLIVNSVSGYLDNGIKSGGGRILV
mmetsp:Transcript_16778/g.22530  ORF Transcript_16778/g.22530 Transcript_16778/m.22530 type:complete len:324 (-) Transcript_16778:457-1428(-)